ncbi:terminase gpA endonuclease subunit [Pseudomonas sp. GD04058]|uniref:terminase gpA endonuclease subunit n=1 Tax=Pseudomonas sp. GD04058 TaxID=2975429 RepID=UPI003260E94C
MPYRLKRLMGRIAKVLRPPPLRAAWRWADDKRVLPPGSPEPGPWISRRAPWVKGITEAIRDPMYRMVCGVMGAQMSKTDGVLLNSVGWRMDDDPGPVLYIGPTRKNVESVSVDRLSKLLRSVPSLFEGLAKGKKDKISEKFINGQRLGFGWAGSATELASHPSRDVFIDERDRMGNNVGGEGDPVTLADARISNYIDGNVTVVSTPTYGAVATEADENGLERWQVSKEVNSPIWQLWQQGTRHEWAWPCPHKGCNRYFVPRFSTLFIPDGATPKQALKEARLFCPHCGDMIEEGSKEWMNDRGVFIAPDQHLVGFIDDEAEEQDNGAVIEQDGEQHLVGFGLYLSPVEADTSATFWVSGLCSPWQTFGQRARKYVAALLSGAPGQIQAAINTAFGELYMVKGEAPEWQRVAALRRPYAFGEVPRGVQLIVVGVDVQGDRLVYVVRGFGYNLSSWLIEHGEIWGDTEQEQVWHDLGELLETTYEGRPIMRMLIDSGYKPGGKANPVHMVYQFCRRYYGRAVPTKGRQQQDKPYKFADVDQKGHERQPLKLMLIHTDHFKSWVHSRIEWPVEHAGAWFISQDASDDYCQQVVAEARLVTQAGRVFWHKLRTDNHYFDAEVLATAAAHLEQAHRLQRTGDEMLDVPNDDKSAAQADEAPAAPAGTGGKQKSKPPSEPAPPAPRRKKRRRGAVSECEL